MRQAVRAIIIKDNKLLVMHRNKFGEEYDTLPGGKIEIGETPEEALHREVAEETTIRLANPRLVMIERAGQPWGDQYIFLCNYVDGEPGLHPESDEDKINKLGQNLYKPAWLELNKLSQRPFRSEKLKTFILQSVPDKWPENPAEITS